MRTHPKDISNEHGSDLIGVDAAHLATRRSWRSADQDDVEIRGMTAAPIGPSGPASTNAMILRRKCDGPDDSRDDEANDHCGNQGNDQDRMKTPKIFQR